MVSGGDVTWIRPRRIYYDLLNISIRFWQECYPQDCKGCNTACKPYRLERLRCAKCNQIDCTCSDDGKRERHTDPNKPHRSDLCHKCRAGKPCQGSYWKPPFFLWRVLTFYTWYCWNIYNLNTRYLVIVIHFLYVILLGYKQVYCSLVTDFREEKTYSSINTLLIYLTQNFCQTAEIFFSKNFIKYFIVRYHVFIGC